MVFDLVDKICDFVIDLYILALILRCVFDWIDVLSRKPLSGSLVGIRDFIYTITEPPLRALRRVFPPIPMGRVYFDTSFIILWIALGLLQWLL